MILLGIETSCDETGAAVVEKKNGGLQILSNEVASSLSLHAQTGGIIPEAAAREQLRYILPIIEKAIEKTSWEKIDGIAVTYGPGLIGSLLVGVETAKTLSYVLKKPIIPVNHLYGHIYANWLSEESRIMNKELRNKKLDAKRLTLAAEIEFPALALVVSGGHTDLVMMQSHETLEVIGGTRDDAAGEAFDKIGRLLGMSYPAGAEIANRGEKGDPKAFQLPRPMIGSDDFDFSFSGLKTAALTATKNAKEWDEKTLSDFCASVQWSIVDVLVKKTIKAAKFYNVKSILLGGGVAANQMLREQMQLNARRYELDATTFVPRKELCTDNAAMIAAAGFFTKPASWQEVTANPELYY
ncbi:MAG: tRNA (adenosine(37)-N6)-threonylcarbamoyltransferase complex transferase subunit TsaD [bacterium]|nr:tRNA (adenosine(37)-N6)-threonylcarbamoyltransferase complex transferase subunit TsaD [bacterium]